jgi:hypothetical protein
MTRRTRSLLICGLAALALATTPANHDPVHAATRQVVTLSFPRVSVVDAARTVVTFEAKGDIRGLLTLTLIRGTSEKGAASLTGEWALVSRYVYDMLTGDADLGPTGEDAGYGHREGLAFAERGTIHGPVTGGTLGFDDNGQLSGIESLGLQIADGNLEFAGALGSGSVSASDLQDVTYGSGSLVLATEVK